MATFYLKTPLVNESLKQLHVGDEVFLSGTI